MLKFKLILIALTAVLFASSGQAVEVRLHATSDGQEAKVLWQPQSWPETLVGFNLAVASEETAPNYAWSSLNNEPFKPTTSADRDWSDVIQNKDNWDTLIEGLPRVQSEMERAFRSEDWLQALKVNEKGNAINMLSNITRMRIELALQLGFATILDASKLPENAVIGLFPVYDGGAAASEPVATVELKVFETVKGMELPMTKRFSKVAKGMELIVNVPQSTVEASGLFGIQFFILDEGADPEDLPKRGVFRIASFDEASGEYTIKYLGLRDDPNVKHTCVLVPQNIFKQAFDKIVIPFDPSKDMAATPFFIAPPSFEKSRQLDDSQSFEFAWKYPEEHMRDLAGFIIERRLMGPVRMTQAFEPVTDLLAPETRSHVIDESEFTFGSNFQYRIVSVGKDQSEKRSIIAFQELVDNRLPPAPTDLRAEVVIEEGKRFIELTWKRDPEGIAKQFVLYEGIAGSESILKQLSFPLVKGESCRYPVRYRDSELLTLRIAGLSHQFLEGPYAEVDCLTPGQKVDPIESARVQAAGEGERILVTWQCEPSPWGDGFEILNNNEVVATLKPEAREWLSDELEPGFNYSITVRCFNLEGLQPSEKYAGNGRVPSRFGIPEKITDIKFRQVEEDGKPFIKVTWSHPHKTASQRVIDYYDLFAANEAGELVKVAEIPYHQNEYLYSIEEEKGKQIYIFMIEGRRRIGLTGKPLKVSYQPDKNQIKELTDTTE